MLGVRLPPILLIASVTAAAWGCGGDSKSTGGSGGHPSSGASGKGGASTGGTNGGAAGKGSRGGTGGTNGGASGKSGTASGGASSGGKGGTGGAGKGGAGKGGADAGGEGGTSGEGGDAPVGSGGEGGSGNLTVAEACDIICEDRSGLACDDFCQQECNFLVTDSPAPDEYLELIQCEATKLGPNDYECYIQPSFPGLPGPGASWGTPCEAELCAWTCADATFAIENTFLHCGC